MLRTKITLPFAIMAIGHTLQAQIQINEVMQSNIDCIMDDLNEFPDSWVELFNAGTDALDLSNYLIGTEFDGSDAYRLATKTINPSSYALVYCDKAETDMHTSFRLESGKNCTVYIFDNNMSIVDSVHIEKKQPAPNISYGRKSSNSEEWGYQYTPTPQAANCGVLCTEILGDPIFSEPGRVLTSNQTIEVALTMPKDTPEGAVIRYTINGEEPTTSSTLYHTPIEITETKLIRAKLFCEGYLSPRSITHSYIYLNRDMNLPVVSIVSKNSYFADGKIGILAWGTYNPNVRNYEYNWRRPINFELFLEPDSTSEMNVLCETRVTGGMTRKKNLLKSLALYTHKRFGQKHFKYEFWPDQRPGKTHHKSFLLRDAGNDFDYLYLRDAIIQRSVAQHVDLDWQAWRPAIIFINGVYKGILNFRERSNEDNIYTNYDELEDIDMVENWHILKKGTLDNFTDFKAFYQSHDHTLEEYAERMDIDEYLNLMIMNIFYNNQDFPGNNFVMWRPREEGGRWRFLAKDTDLGLGLYNYPNYYKTLEWLYDPNYDPVRTNANNSTQTKLFRRLIENEDFKSLFIDRMAIYMGDFLNFNAVWKIWGPMYEQIKNEYPIHRNLYNSTWPNYADELTWTQNWLKGRPEQFYSQLMSFFNLSSPVNLFINKDIPEEELEKVGICMNGVNLSAPIFNGKFFAGRKLALSATQQVDEDGQLRTSRTVISWKVDTYTTASNYTTEIYTGSSCHLLMPSGHQVIITPQYGESEGLEELTQDNVSTPTLFYDLNGRPLNQLHPGINIVRDGQGRTRKIIL